MRLSTPTRCRPARSRGVALIIVLLVVFALTVTAATFAYQMRVETRLATATRSEAELEWLGRSGVEYAKWVLIEQQRMPGEQQYHGLNQFWAGGVGRVDSADNLFEGLTLDNIELGEGRISIRIVDEERKFNINMVSPPMLDLALSLIGAEAADNSTIANSLLDWIDRDDFPKAGGGAESADYLTLDPPYLAKNGPIDDITELLKISGVTPQLFYGPNFKKTGFLDNPSGVAAVDASLADANQSFGLVDVFCALSTGQVNINTAPEPVISLALGGDPLIAREVIKIRAGADGIDGTEDDEPARSGGEIGRLLGPAAGAAQQGSRWVTMSSTFLVRVSAEFGNARRNYVATIRRGGQGARDFTTLVFRRE